MTPIHRPGDALAQPTAGLPNLTEHPGNEEDGQQHSEYLKHTGYLHWRIRPRCASPWNKPTKTLPRALWTNRKRSRKGLMSRNIGCVSVPCMWTLSEFGRYGN